jgi:hypothetical protein
MRRALLLLAPIAVLCVLAAGCGGDDNGGGGEQLTKAEFVTKADAICKEFDDKGDALKPDLPPGVDPTSASATDEQVDKFGDYLDDVVELFREELDELHDLNPPDELDDQYTKALSLLDETGNEIEEAAEAAHDADKDKLKEKLEEAGKHGDEADQIAKDIGLKECGSS